MAHEPLFFGSSVIVCTVPAIKCSLEEDRTPSAGCWVQKGRMERSRLEVRHPSIRQTSICSSASSILLASASIKTTMRYAHVLDEEVAETLELLFNSKRAQRKNK